MRASKMNKYFTGLLIFTAFALCSITASAAPFSKIQNDFLECLQRERLPTSIYLVDGVKLQGQIGTFDSTVIILSGGMVDQMVSQNAIATIVPAASTTGVQPCNIVQ